jgi:hypothetical protein
MGSDSLAKHDGGGPRAASVAFRNVYLQYCAYVPLQTSFFFRNPEVNSSL